MALASIAVAGCTNLSSLTQGPKGDAGDAGTLDASTQDTGMGDAPQAQAADSTVPTESGAPDSTVPMEAGTPDAPHVDANHDAAADAGPHFCATVDADFCADFDEGNVITAWPMPVTWMPGPTVLGTLALDPTMSPPSPPDALLSATTLDDAGLNYSTAAILERSFPVAATALHLDFFVYFQTPPPTPVDFLMVTMTNSNCTMGGNSNYNLHLRGATDSLGGVSLEVVEEQCGVMQPPAAFSSDVLAGKWLHFVIDGTFMGTGQNVGTLIVALGAADAGPPLYQGALTPFNGSPLVVSLGVRGGLFGQNDAPWSVDYDNVIIDVQ
jgi:hypothetical protein